jgi:hypothetical protein
MLFTCSMVKLDHVCDFCGMQSAGGFKQKIGHNFFVSSGMGVILVWIPGF